MGYYIAVTIGTTVGFLLGAMMSKAEQADRQCASCRHHHQIPEDVPDWLGKGHIVCAACRGVDYELPGMIQSVSLVRPDAYCNEFQPMEDEGG